jgi:hypothetical protein
VLYFLEEQGTGRVKIGFAKDPAERVRRLQTANPRPLILIGVVRGGKEDERVLHQRLTSKGKHVSGEWFVYDEEVRALLSAYDRSLYQAIQQEKALRSAQSLLDDMSKAIEQLRRTIRKTR